MEEKKPRKKKKKEDPEPDEKDKDNIVLQNNRWAETLKREKRVQRQDREYDYNPRTLVLITDKPTNKNREERPPAAKADLKKLSAVFDAPKQRFAHPQTTSHEAGWNTELMAKHRSNYGHHRKMDDATKFAESYVLTQGQSPMKQEMLLKSQW